MTVQFHYCCKYTKWMNQFCSVTRWCPTLCIPTDCSTPGLPVHHQLLQFIQTHVHWVQSNHPTILSSVVPFFSCPQSFLASGSFQMSQFFTSGGQSIAVSASAPSVLPMNTQGWSPLGWTCWTSLKSKDSSPAPQFESINFQLAIFFMVKRYIGLYGPLYAKWCLHFLKISRFVIAFLSRGKYLWISLQSPYALTLSPRK